MQQQINFYRAEFRPRKKQLGSGVLLAGCGVMIALMIAAFGYVTYELAAVKAELHAVNGQEQAAIQRLENFSAQGDGSSGDKSWEQQLEEAKRARVQFDEGMSDLLTDLNAFNEWKHVWRPVQTPHALAVVKVDPIAIGRQRHR